MQEIVIEIMNRFGYLGIGLLIVVETIFPPIPSEVILTFGGFLTTCSKMTIAGVIFVSTAASVASAFLLYGAGALLSPQRLGRLLDSKFCKRLGFKKEEISDTLKWFDGRGRKAVFFGRCVPIIRSLISIPAGMARMNLAVFTVFTVAGSLIWDTVLVVLGILGDYNRVSGFLFRFYMDCHGNGGGNVCTAGLEEKKEEGTCGMRKRRGVRPLRLCYSCVLYFCTFSSASSRVREKCFWSFSQIRSSQTSSSRFSRTMARMPFSTPSLNIILPNVVIVITSFTLSNSFLFRNLSANVYNTACIFSISSGVMQSLAVYSIFRLRIIRSLIFMLPDISGVRSNGTSSAF